jgi:hypothetical protein
LIAAFHELPHGAVEGGQSSLAEVLKLGAADAAGTVADHGRYPHRFRLGRGNAKIEGGVQQVGVDRRLTQHAEATEAQIYDLYAGKYRPFDDLDPDVIVRERANPDVSATVPVGFFLRPHLVHRSRFFQAMPGPTVSQ